MTAFSFFAEFDTEGHAKRPPTAHAGAPPPAADADTQARVIQGLLTGIGFIGGGAILKQGTDVRGLATAASIWCTGAVGAAVAYERTEIAVVLSLITFITLRLLTPVARMNRPSQSQPEGSKEKKGAGTD